MNLNILFYFVVGILINSESLSAEEVNTKLVLVQSAIRHGVRSIYLNYPNDTKGSLWAKYGGLAQLTPVGMKQMYEFGSFVGQKYAQFLNSTYDRSRVYVRSTDYDRTLQTSMCFLTGMFGPNDDQKWADNSSYISNWMPIPVHTAPSAIDTVLHANADCPRYDQLRNESRKTSEYLVLEASNKDFLNLMMNYSRLKLNYYTMWQIADKALVEEAHNLTLDKYIAQYYNKIMRINDDNFKFDFYTLEMAKLISGGLMNEIVNNFKKKIASKNSMEFYLYTVHDNYLAGIQKLLNTSTKFTQPNFGSGFIFELREDANGKFYIQLFYKNTKYPGPVVLERVQIYGCEVLCPFDKFLNIAKDKLLTDFGEACKLKTDSAVIGVNLLDYVMSIFKNIFNL